MKPSESNAEKLIAQDPMLAGEDYERYRQALQSALARAERREQMAFSVCLVSGVISFSLMFVGGSRHFGSFDPWDSTATPVSIVLGITFLVASIVFWILFASYYSRFRPNTRREQESLRDEQMRQLERSIAELRELILASGPRVSQGHNDSIENNSDLD